jgi:hypothetical protein
MEDLKSKEMIKEYNLLLKDKEKQIFALQKELHDSIQKNAGKKNI